MRIRRACLSGGGIRSAAFSLGVIQRLAAERLVAAGTRRALGEFDYLSTVSGGGYIGAWLSARLMRADIDAANGIGRGSRDVFGALGDMTGAHEAPAIKNVFAAQALLRSLCDRCVSFGSIAVSGDLPISSVTRPEMPPIAASTSLPYFGTSSTMFEANRIKPLATK